MSDILVERLVVDDIPVYRFYKSTRYAVDEYLLLVDDERKAHIEAGKDDTPMYYAIDVSRSGMFSINYSIQRAYQLVSDKTKIPPSFIAYITNDPNDSVLVSIMDGMTDRRVTTQSRKIYTDDKFDDAIAWLVSLREQHKNDSEESSES